MKKNGFTLIELLAVVGIIAVLVLAVVPNVIDLYNESQIKIMVQQEKNVKDASKIYAEDYCINAIEKADCEDYFNRSGDYRYVCLKTAVEVGYIKEVDHKGNNCDGYTVFHKTSSGLFLPEQTYLWCENDSYNTVRDNKDAIALPTGFTQSTCN